MKSKTHSFTMKKNIHYFFFVIITFLALFPSSLLSQEPLKIEGKLVLLQENQPPYGLKDASIYEINAKTLWDFANQKGHTALELNLDFSVEHHWELVLLPSKVFSDNAQYNLQNGQLASLKHQVKTYKGYLKNQSHISVRFTIAENFIHGFIFDEKGHSFEMLKEGKSLTENTRILVYEESQVKNEARCGSHVSKETLEDFSLGNFKPKKGTNPLKTATTCVDLAITLDWQGYQNVANSNTATFQNTLATMVNIVNGYYAQFDVEYQVAFTHYIYNSPNPWTDAPGNQAALTQNFANWAFPNLQPTNYNCAMLFTGTNMNGIGYAFFGHMCPGDNLRYSEIDYQYSQPTTQRANLMTHELGHLWGAQHSVSSSTLIMSPSIWDGDLNWDAASSSIITNAIDNTFASCLNACGTTDPCAGIGDADGDGYCADIDCYDNIANAYPGAPEICDNIDNDCDGQVDEGACGGTYCTPVHLTSHITNVSLGTIDNSSEGANTVTTGYSDFTNLSTDLSYGTNYTLTVSSNESTTNSKLSAWIDWNQNFTFEANEQVASESGTGSWITSFTVPNEAILGNTRLRIRLQEGTGYAPDACAYSAFYSGETEDYTVNIEMNSGSYCTPIHVGSENELITNVTLGTINNNSEGWTTGITGYSDYTNLSTDLNIGETYTMSVTNNYGWDGTRFGVWADWNQNFTFEASEEVFSFNGNGPWTFSVVPPNNAVLGATRLRVRLQYGANYAPDPCAYANYYSGETEDYTINVLNTNGCVMTSIDFNDFETNWGIWNDGGSDARRNAADAVYAEGTYCVRLRDNTSTSVMTTDNLDLSSFEEITVNFRYYPLSMDNSSEDFWLQISTNGGSDFTTVEEWNLNDEFQNGQVYYDATNITGPFTSNTKLRFRCDASGNSDWVYIDEVDIKGCSYSNSVNYNFNSNNNFHQKSTNLSFDTPSNRRERDIRSIHIFPNPASDELVVEYEAIQNEKIVVELYSLEGKKAFSQSIEGFEGNNTLIIDTKEIPNGIYLLKVNEQSSYLSRRVLILR